MIEIKLRSLWQEYFASGGYKLTYVQPRAHTFQYWKAKQPLSLENDQIPSLKMPFHDIQTAFIRLCDKGRQINHHVTFRVSDRGGGRRQSSHLHLCIILHCYRGEGNETWGGVKEETRERGETNGEKETKMKEREKEKRKKKKEKRRRKRERQKIRKIERL